eukprot:TRINITY_DN38307_c0_g1_i1.p1 TRINITY_DN38307_c0_g1~~TRINITY_DN38307_c0_g1_i1.p1  ORF type:complete len:1025 (-),score=176.29 TRINITY_DN38307_c0_g1_i1:114-2777(-)
MEACRQAILRVFAQTLDVSMFLRYAPKILSSSKIVAAVRLLAVEHILKATRTILASDAASLNRCRVAGGMIVVIDVWKKCITVVSLGHEAAHLVLLFAKGHAKAAASAGGAECALQSWQRLAFPRCLAGKAAMASAALEAAACEDADGDLGSFASLATTMTAYTMRPSSPSVVSAVMPLGVQLYAELLSMLVPHLDSQRLSGIAPIAVQGLALSSTIGPSRSLASTLQLIAKLAHDSGIGKELVRLNAPQAVLELLDTEHLVSDVLTRRSLANAWVNMVTAIPSDSRRQLSTTPRPLTSFFEGCHSSPSVVASPSSPLLPSGILSRIAMPMPAEFAAATVLAKGFAAPQLLPKHCAEGLKKRLVRVISAMNPTLPRAPVYPQQSRRSSQGLELNGVQLLRFDANFEGGNLRSACALSPTEYELELAVDISNPAHCQWFYFRFSCARPGVVYSFYLINFSKPSSLFEEGSQPVVFSKKRMETSGVGWTREGFDLAYFANGATLGTKRSAYTLAFSLTCDYADDEVDVAHFFPYGYGDLRRDVELWSRGQSAGAARVADARVATSITRDTAELTIADTSARTVADPTNVAPTTEEPMIQKASEVSPTDRPVPPAPSCVLQPSATPPVHVEQRQLLKTSGGLSVDTFCVGAPAGTRPMALLVARAHPGESPASWVMRGVCEMLMGDGGKEASACRAALTWVLVPMLNPDGVVVGNTRTNFGGVDLNRHHHDDLALETCALRALVSAATVASSDSGPPLVFVDMHGHSRRRGVFVMGNAGCSAKLPMLLAKRSPLFDLVGSSMLSNKGGKDSGVGRVAMAQFGVPHSFTLEASFGMPQDDADQLSPADLESVGRAMCVAIRELAERPDDPCAEQFAEAQAMMSDTVPGDDE